MKYMGSKRWMLRNGLGHLIQDQIKTANRFVDLFSGSGAVAQFAATADHAIEVRAYDLQLFCVVLAGAVVARDAIIETDASWELWKQRARAYLSGHRLHSAATITLPEPRGFTRAFVECERLQSENEANFAITAAYGGHYFSHAQALWIDALRATLPTEPNARIVALAALVQAASQCAASPGHTAQPFQPTRGAKRFLYEAWQRDVVTMTGTIFQRLALVHAKQCGGAKVLDANLATADLAERDLVFVDPPYSGVHYSRFYHVLETIAQGECKPVSGVGRYPPPEERPRSRYSVQTESLAALEDLLKKIAAQGARALLTFPEHSCSNGLSGDLVGATAAEYFKVQRKAVANRFSTLGGTKSSATEGNGRTARQTANELIFVLTPK